MHVSASVVTTSVVTAVLTAATSLVTASTGLATPSTGLASAYTAPARSGSASAAERVCSAPAEPGRMRCMALRRTDMAAVMASDADAKPATPSGYGPDDLRSAYALPDAITTATVAIVDAYDDPRAESDLAVYRSTYGLPPCTTDNGCFTKVNQDGDPSPLPDPDRSWAGEISLDLDMVSATCPTCHILLVEADSNGDRDLFAAVDRAVRMGAKFVSNSWGGPEDGSIAADDRVLNRPGVAITASTGDDGYDAGPSYPASSPYVTAVGGTSLTRSSNGRGWSESAWGGAGSGCSRYEPRPAWQTGTTGCPNRAEADVSAVANPSTGVAVYQTYGARGWAVYGGTSVAAPIIAAVYALAGAPAPGDVPVTYAYADPDALNDVTSGDNGSCRTAVLCTAGPGWDGPTGLGTPSGLGAFGARPVVCPGGDLVGNGGFETGSTAPWTAPPGAVVAGTAAEPAHTGGYYLRLDGTGRLHTDTATQSVTIPAACRSATLTFWLRVETAERTQTTAYDVLSVAADGTRLTVRTNLAAARSAGSGGASEADPADSTGWLAITADLSSFAGSTVTLSFAGTEDGSLPTTFSIDDVSVAAGPDPTP